ncbi:MAG: Na+/H+ antiporter NhaC, partial [Kordiimonadaceae bacterium]|nr:Na+/H+ antiporter NhaC [Kordiimonadaceae bacterium]
TLIDILGSLQDGFKTSTGHEGLDLLVNRGGIQSMMWTLSLALFALALGGILDVTGYLTVLLKKTLSNVKTVFSGMLTAMCTGLICCLSMGETYISIIVTSQLMKKKFEEMKFKPYLLSRSIEESTTLPSSLVPWSMPGAFYFGVLGVPVIEYAPWAILNYLNMFVSLGMAYFGYGIFKNRKD